MSGVSCKFAYGPADATACHYLMFHKIQIVFTFMVPAHLVSDEQNPEAIK